MIIAEISQNFLGITDLAKFLISNAKQGGADLAKFQLYDHNKLYSGHPEIPNVEIDIHQANELFEYGNKIGIEVFFSVFDVKRVRWCEAIGVKSYKIAAGNFEGKDEVIQAVKETGKMLYLSVPYTEYCDSEDRSVQLLYCVNEYPADIHKINWGVAEYYRGFSDHTIGLDAAKIALARHCWVVEKHFCLDHQTGVDAPWSMDYTELKELKRFETICTNTQ